MYCGLWHNYTAGTLAKFKSCYLEFIKASFGYQRFDNVTRMLVDLSYSSFDAVDTVWKWLTVH